MLSDAIMVMVDVVDEGSVIMYRHSLMRLRSSIYLFPGPWVPLNKKVSIPPWKVVSVAREDEVSFHITNTNNNHTQLRFVRYCVDSVLMYGLAKTRSVD